MLFCLSKNNTDSSFEWLSGEGYHFGYKLNEAYWMHYHQVSNENFTFFSEQPIGRNDSGELFRPYVDASYLDIIQKAQNNFVGLQVTPKGSDFEAFISSARITRARLYFIIKGESIYFSHDLRQLLPYSSRRANPAASYSILKYGDVPEYITVIEDIFSVPVGRYLKFTNADFQQFLSTGKIDVGKFTPYFHLTFPMDGGDIAQTEKLLKSNFKFLAANKPLVPVSGGVDSTLINSLINEFSDEAYPAYYMQFGKDDPEVAFAKKAAEGTKADLEIDLMQPEDTIAAFEFQNQKLIQPIGESSTIAIAHYFRKTNQKGRYILDGTLADGCYGSRNYNIPLFADQAEKPMLVQKATEHVATWLKVKNTKGNERFYPRDTNQPDKMMQFMHMYLGPFANTWLKNAKEYTLETLPLWQMYYEFLDEANGRNDEWARYSVFKMVNYACKNNTAKTYDNTQPDNSAFYPFTWLSVLQDQGHYSWLDKTKDNTIKYVLKKLLEQYKPHDFIYRKKVGLNSTFEDWIHIGENRTYLAELIGKKSGIAEFFLGAKKQKFLVDKFKKERLQDNLANLVINLAIQQAWMDYNEISIG